MVPLIVFFAHIIAFTAVFTKRWQEEGMTEGFLGVLFMLLIFFVGWSMASFVMRLILPPEGFGRWMDADAAALAVLAVCESVFYYFYFRKDTPGDEPDESVTSH
jgi:hypothetical protein